MGMLRNGKSTFLQLQVTDIVAFTIPDTSASPTAGNFSNVYARFGTLLLGSGSAAFGETQTGLQTEIPNDTKGLLRHTGTEVKTWLEDATSGENAWKFHAETTWQVTAGQTQMIREFGFGNGSTTVGNGIVALRGVYNEDFPLVENDFFNLEVVVKITGSFTQYTASTTPGGMVSYAGLREMCRNILSESTTQRGPNDSSAGTWQTGSGYGETWDAPAKFDTICLGRSDRKNPQTQAAGTGTVTATNGSNAITGSGTNFDPDVTVGDAISFGTEARIYHVATRTSDTALTLTENYEGSTGSGKSYKVGAAGLDRKSTRLTDEVLDATHDPTNGRNDIARKTGASITGELKRDPDSVDPETYGSVGFTVFAGDTVQWRGRWTSTNATLITTKEQSVENAANPRETRNGGSGSTSPNQVMLIRQIYRDGNPIRNTDEYEPVIRLQAL